MKSPLISIVIPVWKTMYLGQAIDSVLRQTYTNYELIVVESRRLNDFEPIMDRYDDPRIRIYRHDPMPMVENWDKCMAYSKGEFLILLCDDDSFDNEHLQNLVELTCRYSDVDLFHSRIRMVDESSRIVGYSSPCAEYETPADFIYIKSQFGRSQFISDFMYRATKFRAIGGFVERPMAWYTDVDTAYAMAVPNGVACANDPTFRYRCSSENVSSNLKLDYALEAVAMHFEQLEKTIRSLPSQEHEYQQLMLKNLPKWRDKAYASAYGRKGRLNYPFAPLVNAFRFRRKYKVSLARAVLTSFYALKPKAK